MRVRLGNANHTFLTDGLCVFGGHLALVDMEPPFYRCYRVRRDPIHFNHGAIGRFNAPAGEYGVLSLAVDAYCSFIETFGQSMGRNARGISVDTERDLARSCLCSITVQPNRSPLRLVDLSGEGLRRIGADGRLNTMTNDRAVPRRWALTLHRYPDKRDGLLYRVRHDPSRTGIALFDRVGRILQSESYDNLLKPVEALR